MYNILVYIKQLTEMHVADEANVGDFCRATDSTGVALASRVEITQLSELNNRSEINWKYQLIKLRRLKA